MENINIPNPILKLLYTILVNLFMSFFTLAIKYDIEVIHDEPGISALSGILLP